MRACKKADSREDEDCVLNESYLVLSTTNIPLLCPNFLSPFLSLHREGGEERDLIYHPMQQYENNRYRIFMIFFYPNLSNDFCFLFAF